MSENQTLPAEYEPVVSMIQKEESIKKGVLSLKKKILVSAGEEFNSWPEEKQDKFFERTIISIAKDENLKDCFLTPEGKLSIIEAIENSVSTGLEVGGKHAYLVPQKRNTKRKDNNKKDIWCTEVRFSIRDIGYYALLCGGKQPIFLDLRWSSVYEKDKCTINSGTGEVNHEKAITDDRGKFLGVWVQCKKINSQLEVDFFSKNKIDQWMECSSTKYDGRPWEKWYDEMGVQASIRHFCSKYAQAKDLLASAIYDDDESAGQEKSSIDKVDEALNKKEPEEKPEQQKKPDKTEKKEKDGQEDLDIF
jgi:recombinational DNA repair protein RecT